MRFKKAILRILVTTTLSSLLVITIYISSEEKIHQNNAFTRKYIPNQVEKIGKIDLNYNSFYIAGMTEDSIYLGNVTVPLQVISMSTNLSEFKKNMVSITKMDLPYRRVKIEVVPPYFYLSDGTIPIIFKGKTNDWLASVHSYGDAFFNQCVIIDSTIIGINSLSEENNKNVLGTIQDLKEGFKISLNKDVLKAQIDGRFDSDGMLLYNEIHKQLIYVYYYRNS